jgi:predicted lactoylglutathione lyase
MQIGDTVRFLNTVGGGVVKGFQNKNLVIVEDEHGFDFPVLITECIVVKSAETEKLQNTKVKEDDLDAKTEENAPQISNIDDNEVEETPGGNKITTCLIYLPTDIKALSNTTFECFFVNDSNYYLFINYMSRTNNAWQSRYNGLIEPNTKLFLEEFSKTDLNDLEQVCVQYVAFKHNKPYGIKSPVSVELRIDTVKFYKLHSFKENDYFDDDAQVYYITKNDIPECDMLISNEDIQKVIREKEAPSRRPRIQKIAKKDKDDVLEVDLHINELLDSTAGMSNKEMLDYQMSKFREVMNENINNKRKKIVFIHGKGDGVLKSEIIKAIRKEYKKTDYQDASFQEYGYGATMIIIK